MKLICHRPTFATAFQIVSSVIPSRTPKDILKNINLQVSDGKTTLIGTDQEVGIRYEVSGVEADSDGQALLPAVRVLAILRELTEDGLNIEVTEDAIWIRAGHSEFRLSAEDPLEYPLVAGFEESNYFILSAQSFKEQIHRTVFATDVESTRYALGGVLMELEREKLTMAATDSRRLAVVTTACKMQGTEDLPPNKPVVPAKAMLLIERSIPDDQEEVFVAARENDVLVRSGSSTIYSRLVEGRFPSYQEVIPLESNISIDLVVGPFYTAIRQAQIVTNEESRGVVFAFSQGTLTLNSQAVDIGQSTVELPIAFDGEDLSIIFDPRFIAEFLRILPAESRVKLELIDAENAAVFRTEDSYIYVVMPLSKDR